MIPDNFEREILFDAWVLFPIKLLVLVPTISVGRFFL